MGQARVGSRPRTQKAQGRCPRPRPLHLHRETTRHGKVVWYVRIGGAKGPRRRLRAAFGSPEFDAEYRAAIAQEPPPRARSPESGTLAWLIERYRETAEWEALSAATRRQRENFFKHLIDSSGATVFTRITTHTIIAGRERRAKTPHQARNFLDAMRGLFRWAAAARHVKHDP